MVSDRNSRAAARLGELGLGGYPTTFFDGGYGEVSGGYSDPSVYTAQIDFAGGRQVTTGELVLTVETTWLNGQGSPDDDLEITVTIALETSISIDYPDGVAEFVAPGDEASFAVTVEGIGGTPVPGTGRMYYSISDGPYVDVAMAESAPNEYIAVLPAIGCGDYVDYYFSVEEQSEGVVYDHDDDPYHAIASTVVDTLFADDFETDLGWSFSGLPFDEWERGAPVGLGGSAGGPDPEDAYSGSNILGYNLGGDYANGMPEYSVTSPAIDCSASGKIELSFRRWLGVESPAHDHAYVRVSTDGASWSTVWENPTAISEGSWSEQVYDITPYASGEPTVYVQFTMGATDGTGRYCGWNVDDLALVRYVCEESGLTISTTSLPDWTVGHPYSQALSSVNGNGIVAWLDRDNNLIGSGLSVSSGGMVSGTPAYSGNVFFTAEATDETPTTAVKTFVFSLNPAVEVTTTSLADGTEGEEYSSQLEAVGGTGALTWSDLNDDLSTVGLTLSESGLLSGTPTTDGEVTFTAVATDAVGAEDQQELTLQFETAYICGDPNADELANITDAVYLISFIFNAGPEPDPFESGDANCDELVNITDAVYLISYIFNSGAPPCDTDNNGEPDC